MRARRTFRIPTLRLGAIAIAAAALWSMPGLAGPTMEASAEPGSSRSCAANLTCARQTKVVSAKDFKWEVPDLSLWEPVARDAEAGTRPTALATAPDALRDPTTGMKLVRIPGACYLTRSVHDAPDGGTLGGQKVCIDPFYIGAHEVTFEDYDRFARVAGRELPEDEGFGRGQRPVINVSFYDALAFAKWLSRESRVRYRLPTEVEWEHAARAGARTTYPWGDELGSNRANCDGCGSRWDAVSTAPVGSFTANTWGLYDVIGNVGEWTCSMRDPDPGRSFETCDSPYETRRRTYRNGGWSDEPDRLGAHFRDWNAAVRKTDFVGFRLVRECPECAPSPGPQAGRLAGQQEHTEVVR